MPDGHSALIKNKGRRNEDEEGMREEGKKADDVRHFDESI